MNKAKHPRKRGGRSDKNVPFCKVYITRGCCPLRGDYEPTTESVEEKQNVFNFWF